MILPFLETLLLNLPTPPFLWEKSEPSPLFGKILKTQTSPHYKEGVPTIKTAYHALILFLVFWRLVCLWKASSFWNRSVMTSSHNPHWQLSIILICYLEAFYESLLKTSAFPNLSLRYCKMSAFQYVHHWEVLL